MPERYLEHAAFDTFERLGAIRLATFGRHGERATHLKLHLSRESLEILPRPF